MLRVLRGSCSKGELLTFLVALRSPRQFYPGVVKADSHLQVTSSWSSIKYAVRQYTHLALCVGACWALASSLAYAILLAWTRHEN